MPLIEIIAISVVAIAVIGLGVLFVRKAPLAAAIDVGLQREPQREKKQRLIERRLTRKFISWWAPTAEVVRPAGRRLTAWWSWLHRQLVDLEHEYRVRALPVFLDRRQKHKVQTEIAVILKQATACTDEGEYGVAEEKCLQAIRLDPRSIPAFEQLGALYRRQQEYQHAKEVYEFLLKLVGEDEDEGELVDRSGSPSSPISSTVLAEYHLNAADALIHLSDQQVAWEHAEVALHHEPNNPRVLDAYIEISLQCGKKGFAEAAINKVRSTNPENAKISDWEQRVAALDDVTVRHAEAAPINASQEPSENFND